MREVAGPQLVNLAAGKTTTPSSNWSEAFDCHFATDGDVNTRWHAADWDEAGAWLIVDFGQPTQFNRVRVRQAGVRIERYKVQYLDGMEWRDAFSGVATEPCWSASFPPVKSSKVRLFVVSTRSDTPSIFEFEVYYIMDVPKKTLRESTP